MSIIKNNINDKIEQQQFSELHAFLTEKKIPVSMIIGSLKVFDFVCPECAATSNPLISDVKTFFGLGGGVELRTRNSTHVNSDRLCNGCQKEKLGNFVCTDLPFEIK